MKKTEIELTRHNVTPAQFLSYVRATLKKRGIRDLASDLDLDYFRRGNDLNFDIRHEDGSHERSVSKPYEMQTYCKWVNGAVYNEICEFEFDDEKAGHGYYYICNIEAETQPKEETADITPESVPVEYEEERTMKNEIRVHISKGNSKVGQIPNFSLVPGRTCTPEACRTCLKEGCYAMKSYRMYPSVRKAWDDNTNLAVNNLERLEGELMKYFDNPLTRPRFFRVHVGGDFVTYAYAEMWARIATAFPDVNFLAFTKCFDIVDTIDFPDNFSIVLSAWKGCAIPERLKKRYAVAYVSDCDDVPGDAIRCPGHCDTCGACWGLAKRGLDVVFDKH